MTTPEPATAKGEETRQRIVDAALRLFEADGYTKTTMRAIAGEAGVSVGNTYYYFPSKEHLVQGFYQRMQSLHEAQATPALEGLQTLAERWLAMEVAFIDAAEPFHKFAGKFFAVAADPSSPLNPFSDDSRTARDASTAIVRTVLDGSRIKADKRLLAELPELLWLAHMGVVLFWVYDASPGQRRTRHLVAGIAPLLERMVGLSRLPLLRPVIHQVLDLAAQVSSQEPHSDSGHRPVP